MCDTDLTAARNGAQIAAVPVACAGFAKSSD
jgi:hypothetical protein